MFTDTEVGMAMAHQRQMRAFGHDAQALVDELDRDIIGLRRQLAAAKAENANLKKSLGDRALDDLAALRALKARAGRH